MRFKIDENLPREAAQLLRDADHDASTVAEEAMKGEDDSGIAAACQREVRVLVTLDTHFADIRSYPPAEHPGIVVLRLRRQEKPHVLSVIRRILPRLADGTVAGRLWIVDEHRIRVRE